MGRVLQRGREPGGIAELVETIDEHRGALEYDWRTRFHLPLTIVGEAMTWGEAVRLFHELVRDPSSRTFAAVAGWDHPITREWAVLVSLHDHYTRANFRDPKPWPTPWATAPSDVVGAASEQVLTQEQIDIVLRRMAGR